MTSVDAVKTLRKKYDCPVWISADGSLTPLTIMSDRMLCNCYRHITKRIDELVSPWAMPMPSGSIAADMMDDMLSSGHADDEYSATRNFLHRWKELLEVEFNRRNLEAA